MNNSTATTKRARPLRVESDSVLRFVTCRVIEERYWLHPIITCGLEPPSRKARRACKALERHCDKRLATLVKNANARRGPFQPELSLTDAKRVARGLIGGALGRAQKHHDVRVYAFEFLNRTAWHRARRPDDLGRFFDQVTLKLSPAPSCEGLSREACRASIDTWIEQLRAKLAAEGRNHGKPSLGIDKVVHTGFEARPKRASFAKRPYVFCEPHRRLEHIHAMMRIMDAHRECSQRFRDGERRVRFPDGTYPPPILQAA